MSYLAKLYWNFAFYEKDDFVDDRPSMFSSYIEDNINKYDENKLIDCLNEKARELNGKITLLNNSKVPVSPNDSHILYSNISEVPDDYYILIETNESIDRIQNVFNEEKLFSIEVEVMAEKEDRYGNVYYVDGAYEFFLCICLDSITEYN